MTYEIQSNSRSGVEVGGAIEIGGAEVRGTVERGGRNGREV